MPRSCRRNPRSRLPRGWPSRRRAQQVLAHEPVEVAVEHALGVAGLVAGAVILHPLGGMKGVGADLRSPLRGLLLAALGRQLLRALSLLLLEKLRPQEAH